VTKKAKGEPKETESDTNGEIFYSFFFSRSHFW